VLSLLGVATSLLSLSACLTPAPAERAEARAAGPLRGKTEVTALAVPCVTCHPSDGARSIAHGTSASQIHASVGLRHGDLSCFACHDRRRRDHLHLADGALIAFTEGAELCSQCHGPQRRDYDHGAHGGMTGAWVKSQAPRQRNTCVTCHAPHAPAYPQVQPAPRTRDRDPLAAPRRESP